MPKWTKEQSEAIYNKGQNIIVSAGAGSGKTAVLSERVLTHVQNGISIDDLLILTFTNAAAAEMKDRIRTKLSKDEKLKEEADKVDIAYITTFDAYALSLVKKYNHLLNISDNVSIIDTSLIKLKKEEFLEEIFEEYYNKEDKKFLKLINDFCLKDDKEIFEAILNINDKLDNMYNKKDYLENYLNNYYSDNNINTYIDEYINLIEKKTTSIKNQINHLSSYVDYKYIEKLNDLLLNFLNAKTYNDIKINMPDRLPPLPRGTVEEAKAIKASISNTVKEIKELTKYESTNTIKQSILSTKNYISIIIEIILKLDKRVEDFKKKNNSYEFIDISKLAIRILEENKEVRDELKYKYKEILIDEYQDTNDLQDIFVSYIENNNVYMVGDIKQSIYRFRNANPLLFKNKYDAYTNNNGGMKIDLNKNFRSRKEVTEDINLIFNLIMNDQIGGADYLKSHQIVFGNTAYNSVDKENYKMDILTYTKDEESPYTKEEIEIFTIARDIQNKINNKYKIMDKETNEEREVSYKDFVILMDRSTSFENYKKIFEYLNIPLAIYKDQTISSEVDIYLIKNLYNIIISIKEKTYDTKFKYSFMSILRSYLYNIEDEKIFKIITTNNYRETDLYQKAKEIAIKLDELTNKEMYDLIIDTFSFHKKLITVGDINSHQITLEAIGEIAENLGTIGYIPKMFLNYLEEVSEKGLDIKLSLNKEASNSVKIMTIHASKGLEYHICYFSGLSKKFNIRELNQKFYFSNHYGIISPYIDSSIKNTILKTLLKNKYKEEEISEKLRLLYVALTRAREKIIMVTELNPNVLSFKENGVINDEVRESYMSFNDILNSICNYITPYVTNINIDDLNLTKDYNLTKKKNYKETLKTTEIIEVNEYSPIIETIVEEKFSKTTHKLQTKEEKQNINLGLEMHKLFELTDFNNPNYTNLNNYQREKIQAFINTGILNQSINTYKEYEFIYEEDNQKYHGIIDLLIEYKDKYAIVDYKLKDIKDEAYLKQLHGYQKYVKELTNKKVDIYLYSIIDEKLEKIN